MAANLFVFIVIFLYSFKINFCFIFPFVCHTSKPLTSCSISESALKLAFIFKAVSLIFSNLIAPIKILMPPKHFSNFFENVGFFPFKPTHKANHIIFFS